MNNCLVVYVAGRHTFELPIRRMGGTFVADQPARAEELHITKVRLLSEEIDRPVRFTLPSLTLVEGEAGRWTVTIGENEFGLPQYDLEYYATEQFGQRVHQSAVMHWNHDNEEMSGD